MTFNSKSPVPTRRPTKTTRSLAAVVTVCGGLLLVLATAGCPPKPAAEIPPAQNLVVPVQFVSDAGPVVVPPVAIDAAAAVAVDAAQSSAMVIDAGAAPDANAGDAASLDGSPIGP